MKKIVLIILIIGAALVLASYLWCPPFQSFCAKLCGDAKTAAGLSDVTSDDAAAEEALDLALENEDPKAKIAALEAFIVQYGETAPYGFYSRYYRYKTYTGMSPEADTLLEYGKDVIESADLDDLSFIMNVVAYDLADRGLFLDQAEDWARDALELSSEESPESLAAIQDTLGWVLHKAGKSEEAMPLMDSAVEAITDDALLLFHAGSVAEASDAREKAVEFYIRSLAVFGATNDESEAPLNALYDSLHGNKDGLEARLEEARNISREEVIFTSREFEMDAAGWTLPSLEGVDVSLSDFQGKIKVLKFWGYW